IQKDMATAERIFEGIVQRAPADFFASNQLSLVQADQSDPAKKQLALQRAARDAQTYQRAAEAAAMLGHVCYRNDRVDEGLEALQVAVSPGQLSPDTAYYLAACLYEKDKDKLEDA